MTKQIFLLISLIICSLSSLSADINLSLSKTTVGIDEPFTLIFSSRSNVQAQPDFSPLNADFEILSSSQNHSTSIINGNVNSETSWNLELMAKREGVLAIPSIKFDQESSPQKPIEVKGTRITTHDDTLFLETEISPKSSIYEQTQLLYTIRLYRSVNITQATLSDIKVNDPDAIIERFGNDVEYEHYNASGTRYIVLERKYLIFPQHAGELIISPTIFKGRIITGGSSFFHVQSEFKRVSSEEEKILVNSIPPPFQKNNWFAANDVNISEEWSSDLNSIALGEPFTWTLNINANGCLGAQIPAIPLNLSNTLKQYLDKPQITNQTTEEGIIGVKQIKVALIATKPEEITIPEININWWDLKTNQIATTSLPARTIHIQAANIAMASSTAEQLSKNLSELPEAPQEYSQLQNVPLWAWGLIGLNAIWIIGLFIWIIKKIPPIPSKSNSPKHIIKQLKKACQTNDAKQAEAYLLAWAADNFPHIKPLNISGMKPYLSDALQSAVDDLYLSLYGHKSVWRGAALWQAFAAFKPPKVAKDVVNNKSSLLRELYPN